MARPQAKWDWRLLLGHLLTQLLVFAAVVLIGGIAFFLLLSRSESQPQPQGILEAVLIRRAGLQPLLSEPDPLVKGQGRVLLMRWIPPNPTHRQHSALSVSPGQSPDLSSSDQHLLTDNPLCLWIQIPGQIEDYETIDLKSLLDKQYIHTGQSPSNRRLPQVSGRLSILRQQPEEVVLWLDMQINVSNYEPWRMNRPIVVPVVEPSVANPLEAAHGSVRRARDRDFESVMHRASVAQRLVGRWLGNIKGSGGRIHYDIYFQFDDDGRCVHATVRGSQRPRGGYPPGMKYGRFSIERDWLIITVQKFVFDQPLDNDHLHRLGQTPYITLKMNWNGQDLILDGDCRVSDRYKKTSVPLSRANYPDLRQYRPNHDRNVGFKPRPEPTRLNRPATQN